MAMRIDDIDVIDRPTPAPVRVIISLLVMMALMFVIGKAIGGAIKDDPFLSGTEICQKHFGKDYVRQSGYKSADFCVDSSGIPKYPKTWREKKHSKEVR